MNEKIQPIIAAIKDRFGADPYEFRDETSLVLSPAQIAPACLALRDEFSFELLNEMTAVDYWPAQAPRFHLVYRLRSLRDNLMLGLRVPLDGNAPQVDSLTGVYPNANWFEREVWDMFGIRFTAHPDLRRVLMPYDWEGHPLRKDYPLGYEEVQFTFNFDEIDVRKPYAQE